MKSKVLQQLRDDWKVASWKKRGWFVVSLSVTILLGVAGIHCAIIFAQSVASHQTNYLYSTVALMCMAAILVWNNMYQVMRNSKER